MRPRSSGRIGSFFLDFGEIFTRIRGLFEVETTFVRAGAQGTAYLVRTGPGGTTTVIVFDGQVRIDSTRGAWTPLTIGAGQMAIGHPRPPQPLQAAEAELQATRDWVERLERLVPQRTASSGATAAAVAGVALLVAAILASRSDRESGSGTDRSTPQDAPTPPLVAPTGLTPGQAQASGPRLDCRRGVTLDWNAVAGARDYLVRLEVLEAPRSWRAVSMAPTTATRLDVPSSRLAASNRWSVQARDANRIGPASSLLYFACDFVVVR